MGVTAGQDQSSEEFNAAKEKTTIYHAEGDQSPNNGLAEKALVDPAIDPVKERAMVKKIDKYVIPMVMALYLFSFLDRVNVGNARLYGLEADLGMHGNMFQLAVSILFVTYVLGEVPSNWIMKNYVRPSRWIASITVAWGFVATFSGFTQSYAGFIVCRLLLGLFEAGLFPGMVVYLTLFYTKKELALRTAYLFVSAAIAGALSGLLAYGIGHLDGVSGYSGWRWIFIIEGLPTILFGALAWFVLADDADTAYYLNQEERNLVLARRAAQLGTTEVFQWDDAIVAFKDWKTYVFSLSQLCNGTMLYAYSTFLPTIIQQIMPDASRAIDQLLTVPCYATGAICYIALARVSDWKQIRGPIAAVMGTVSAVGYAILLSRGAPGVLYFGCFVVAAGMYVCIGVNIVWLNVNTPRYGKRITAFGTLNSLGNIAGVISPFLYPTNDKPHFTKGLATNLALVMLGVCIFVSMSIYFAWENKQRALGRRDYRMEGKTEAEIVAMGDENPHFRYTC